MSAPIRILDLCTGTGCIPLLLHSLLTEHARRLSILGVDISPRAVALAKDNLKWNIAERTLHEVAAGQIRFVCADIMTDLSAILRETCNPSCVLSHPCNGGENLEWDVMISNPPYISPVSFSKDTARSVRNWEPRLALVPCGSSTDEQHGASADKMALHGDTFYPRLLSIAESIKAKVVLLETADLDQAIRVARLASQSRLWDGIEIWRDWLVQGHPSSGKAPETVEVGGVSILIRGEGNGRAVLCWRGEAGELVDRA